MAKTCFNCEQNIEKPEEGICPSCGVEFELSYIWNNDLQDVCDMAVNFKRKSRYDEAKRIYEKLNVDYPNNPNVYKAWAKTMMASGNYDLALEYFIMAMKLYEFFDDPIGNQSLDDCRNFIVILFKEPRNSQSFSSCLKAVSGNQNYVVNYNTINDCMYIKNQMRQSWLEELQNFTEGVRYVTPESIKETINLQLLIDDTLDNIKIQKTDLIPWLIEILPDNEKKDKFLTHISDML